MPVFLALAGHPVPSAELAGSSGFAPLLLTLAVMLAAGKLSGEAAERIGQPPVLGELVAGLLLGSTALGVLPAAGTPLAETLHVFAQLGVLLLLFQIGLETDLRALFRVGPAALAVACVGVAVPFVLGWLYWHQGAPASLAASGTGATAIFLGAALTATSVGVTARVLSDLGRMDTPEARIILGAAVIDDVIGLVILSIVSGLAAGTAVTVAGVTRTAAAGVGFLVAAILLGNLVVPRIFGMLERLRARYILLVFAVVFAFGLAALAEVAGSAPIVGAFAAGLVLSGNRAGDVVEEQVRPIGAVFVPIFFVNVGAEVDISLLNPSRPGAGVLLATALVVTALAIVGKIVAGWAAPWERMGRLAVGIGMIPRGEVGLIFADLGRRAGVLSDELFGVVLLMVMATTFLAPIGLKAVLGPRKQE